MTFARGLLVAAGLVYLGLGLAYFFVPGRMAGMVEIGLPTPTARVDFRATYGGSLCGFAIFLFLCARRPDSVRWGLLAAGLSLAGFASARIAAIALDGNPRPLLWIVWALEAASAALCLALATRSRI